MIEGAPLYIDDTGGLSIAQVAARSRRLKRAGDLGMIVPGDAVLALSNSGETPELADLIAHSRRFGLPLVAITARAGSALARHAAATAHMLPA